MSGKVREFDHDWRVATLSTATAVNKCFLLGIKDTVKRIRTYTNAFYKLKPGSRVFKGRLYKVRYRVRWNIRSTDYIIIILASHLLTGHYEERPTTHPTTSVWNWKMLPSWHWTDHSGDYWQQAELCTEMVQAEQWWWWWWCCWLFVRMMTMIQCRR